jgi:hypothetical protein
MKTDDFEKQLAGTPLRAVPQEWRGEILSAVQRNRAGILAASPSAGSWWRQLLWPCPQAWAGLSAVWLVICGLHLVAGAEPRAAVQVTATSNSPELRALLAEQHQLFTELLPLPATAPTRRSHEPADRPRSQRRCQPEMPTSQVLAAPFGDLFV